MPYIFVEEISDDMEEADVVERQDYDSIVSERDDARNQRDDAIERAVNAESELQKQKEKYANTFLSKKNPTPSDKGKLDKPATMDKFKIGGLF